MLVDLKKVIGKLNPTTRAALEGAVALCVSRTHFDVGIEHFLLRLSDQEGSDFDSVVRSFQLDRTQIVSQLKRALDRFKPGNTRMPAMSPYLVEAIPRGWTYGSIEHGATCIRSGFILAALLEDGNLSKLVRESSSELGKVDVRRLLTEFANIIQGSIEDGVTPGSGSGTVDGARQITDGPRVFLSYRRRDSSLHAELVFEALVSRVPDISVFRDTDTLRPGMVFSEMIKDTISACDILVAIIGKKWLGIAPQGGTRRIDQQDDWVRLEIAEALRQKKLVIPCLTHGMRMPEKDKLPPDVVELASRHAINLSDTDLRHDVGDLVDFLKTWRRT